MKEILVKALIIAPLILVAGFGFCLRRFGFFNESDGPRLVRVLYWVIMPVQLFQTMLHNGNLIFQDKNLFLARYGSTVITVFLAMVLAFFLHRGDRKKMAFSALAAARPNNLFLGLPTVSIAFGATGAELAGVYLAVAMPGDALIPITAAEFIMAPAGGRLKGIKKSLIQIFKNPLILSSLAGLTVAQLGIPIPDAFNKACSILSAASAGMAILLLGVMLRIPKFSFRFFRSWSDVGLKLFLHPAIVFLCFQIWPVDPRLFKIAMLMNIMPNAINTFIVADGMKLDGEYAVEVVTVSTLLSVLTIPIWMRVVGI